MADRLFSHLRCGALVVLSAVLTLSLASMAEPQDAQQPQSEQAQKDAEQQLEPRAMELLRQAREHISEARTIRVDITHTFNVRGENMKQEMESEFNFALERPNRFALVLEEGMMGETIVSDGQNLYVYLPMLNRYTKKAAPSDISSMFAEGAGPTAMGSGPLAVSAPLLFAREIGGEAATLTRAQYKGTEELNGTQVHRVGLTLAAGSFDAAQQPEEQEKDVDDADADDNGEDNDDRQPAAADLPEDMKVNMDVLIQDGDQPVVRQIRMDLSELMREMAEQGAGDLPPEMQDVQFEMVINYDDWKFNEELPANTFAFNPPEGAQEVENMFGGLVDDEAGPGGAERQHALVGQQAPDFELERLDGSPVNLAQHRGNDIVILDYWATWCGPCVRALPELMSIADEYRDKNVVLYAVNLREDEDKVRQFLQQKQWNNLNVLMDREGEVGQRYQVRGIPQTVIIDKDGTVQAVHVGYSPDIEQRLRKELDTLREGKKLTDDTPQEPESPQIDPSSD